MTYGEEIATVKRQLGETERAVEVRNALSEKLAKLEAAEAADREARERAEEARAATKALREAEAEHRRAQAAPLVAELAVIDDELGALEDEITGKLWAIVRAAQSYHARRHALVAHQHDALARLRAVDANAAIRVGVLHPETLGQFCRLRLRRFEGPVNAAHESAWERQLDRERAAEEGTA